MKNLKIAFWGTPALTIPILASLKEAGLTPKLIITTPDKPKGRKLVLTPPPSKTVGRRERYSLPSTAEN
jgi:methionyl-tRNA formyltransferase